MKYEEYCPLGNDALEYLYRRLDHGFTFQKIFTFGYAAIWTVANLILIIYKFTS